MKRKSIRKSMWGAYWKLHDKRKNIVAKVKGYLDGLPPETRRRIVLGMLAAFAVLALYTFGRAVYDIGRENGMKLGIDHARLLELSVKPNDNAHYKLYYNQYGTEEE